MTDTPPSPEQLDAQSRLDAILTDRSHAYYDGNHPQNGAAIEQVLQLRRVALGPENTLAGPTYREPGDEAPVVVAAPPPLEPERPALAGGATFDDALVAQLETALTSAGLTRYTASMLLGVLADEQASGTLAAWDEHRAGAYLEQKYGAEAADALIADAQQAAAVLPRALREWVRVSGAHCNPRLIVEAAHLWRRSRHAAS